MYSTKELRERGIIYLSGSLLNGRVMQKIKQCILLPYLWPTNTVVGPRQSACTAFGVRLASREEAVMSILTMLMFGHAPSTVARRCSLRIAERRPMVPENEEESIFNIPEIFPRWVMNCLCSLFVYRTTPCRDLGAKKIPPSMAMSW